MAENKLYLPAKQKKRIAELDKQKAANRWIVFLIFAATTGTALGFWWLGSLRARVEKAVEPQPVVWEKESPSEAIRPDSGQVTNQPLTDINAGPLEEQITGMVNGFQGRYVVYGKALVPESRNSEFKNWEFQIGELDQPIQAASLIKVPVMVAVYRLAEKGEVNLDEIYNLREADRVGGSGSLMSKPAGYQVSVRKLLWHMGNESDNTAFTAIVNLIGEDELQKEFLRMGLLYTSIDKNQVTPKEIISLFDCLYSYSCLKAANAEELFDSMVGTWYEDRIPAGVPEGVKVAHKVGTEIGVVGDAGIVYAENPYLLVIMTAEIKELPAKEVLPKISHVVWEWNGNLGS